MTKTQWLRTCEFSLLIFTAWGFLGLVDWRAMSASDQHSDDLRQIILRPLMNALSPWIGEWLELLLLLGWSTAPIFLRPLTTPNASPRQRYAVCSLMLFAGLAWILFIATDGVLSSSEYYKSLGTDDGPSAASVLAIVGLLIWAGYLRIGWVSKHDSE